MALLGVGGCASSSIQTDASTFVGEHAITATRVAATTKTVEAEVAQRSGRPSASQLRPLAEAAVQARRYSLRAGEWDVAKSGEGGEEGVEEEDLPRAETEATSAANELAEAMSTLEAYARAPSTASLARYQSKLARAREVWDESITQIWHLGHTSSPPTL